MNSVISYTGGNGGTHNGQTVTSTGVTGLTAILSAGTFANGNGTLTYTITGTPSAPGTASFAINIGGQSCTLTRQVSEFQTVNCSGQPGRYPQPNPHKYVVCSSCNNGPSSPCYDGAPIGTIVPYYCTCPSVAIWDQSIQQGRYP